VHATYKAIRDRSLFMGGEGRGWVIKLRATNFSKSEKGGIKIISNLSRGI